MLTNMDILALCAYRQGSLHNEVMKGLLQSHHTALSRQSDSWEYGPTTS